MSKRVNSLYQKLKMYVKREKVCQKGKISFAKRGDKFVFRVRVSQEGIKSLSKMRKKIINGENHFV